MPARGEHVRIYSISGVDLLCVALLIGGQRAALAQNSPSAATPPPVTFTAEQDHQNMIDQLDIKALRPGPSGNEKAPNHANYDEAKANPFPNLPDALTLNRGRRVTTAELWWAERRPEIVKGFEEYIYGPVPKDMPGVSWSVVATDREVIGG